jgi:hypothetical protein
LTGNLEQFLEHLKSRIFGHQVDEMLELPIAPSRELAQQDFHRPDYFLFAHDSPGAHNDEATFVLRVAPSLLQRLFDECLKHLHVTSASFEPQTRHGMLL